MARKKIDPKKKEFIKQLIEVYNPKTVEDVGDALKDILGPVMQDKLEAELEEHVGYEKYSHEEKDTSNRRNGSYPKKVKSTYGELEIDVPRDRESTYEPGIIPWIGYN